MVRRIVTGLVAATAWLVSAPALASDCDTGLIALLPVTMNGLRPLVPVKINGKSVDMLLDTGAFTTLIWRPAMARLGLIDQPPPRGFENQMELEGAAGHARTRIAMAQTFGIDQAIVPRVQLIVGEVTTMGD